MDDTGARLRQVEEVCHAALERDASERSRFLSVACGDDASLRREVEALLAHAQTAEDFLGASVGAMAADVMSGSAPVSWIGRRIGPYEVVSPLGAGGMGEVYRARDTQLGRDVAIKVLPPALVADPERLARFEREARVLASLNHPHIGAIYGVEPIDGARALILELVEGETLADRLAKSNGSRHTSRGAGLPLTDVLTFARQIAEALEAAHEKGIVHRDLKPANIKITPRGTVKVLDFGLAKTRGGGVGQTGTDPLDSPTFTPGGTHEGILLGTAAYMSPEQARRQAVDKRADIWAFGSVLYEMLTGRMAFPGSTVSDHIAAILEREPEWTALPELVPVGIRRLLRRCLEKDSNRRLHDIADARIEIEDALALPAAETVAAVATPLTWVVPAAIAVLAVAVVGVLYWTPRSTPSETVHFSVSVPGRLLAPYYIAMAPDGRQMAFVATDSSGRRLLGTATWDGRAPRLIPGTEDAGHPFWSPDSHVVGFISGSGLKTVDVSGGPVHTVAAPAFRASGTWNQDGTLLFVQTLGRLATVSASGGAVSPVVVHDASGREVSATFPRFLPDGRHFLFYSGNRSWESAQGQQRGVYLGSLDSPSATFLSSTKFSAAYAPPGYLLFMRDDHALMAQPFDARRLALTGDPALVAERVLGSEFASYSGFSVSSNGALALLGQSILNTQLTWFDRRGHPLGTIGAPDLYDPETPQLSPDGRRVAVARGFASSEDVWVLDAADGTGSRLTFDSAADETPLWSPDGTRVVFQSNRKDGRSRVYQKAASGAGSDDLLFQEATGSVNLQDWSSDGRFLVYVLRGQKGHQDLWVLPMTGDREPFPLLQTDFNQSQAQVSPNGRWIAYTSDETGHSEVYAQSFPHAGSKRQVSSAGGVQPRWRRDGQELFYLAPDAELMAVPVKGETDIDVGRANALFRTQLPTWAAGGPPEWRTSYDVAPDGQKFLLINPPEQHDPRITVVLNWPTALRK